MSDYFKTPVFYMAEFDCFLFVERGAPRKGDWIVTERQEDEITIERFRGQSHFGVVRVLKFYELQDSEQCTPRPREAA